MVHKLPAMQDCSRIPAAGFRSGRLPGLQRFSDSLAETEVLGEGPEHIQGERPIS